MGGRSSTGPDLGPRKSTRCHSAHSAPTLGSEVVSYHPATRRSSASIRSATSGAAGRQVRCYAGELHLRLGLDRP
jgi:hypothetical protein